MNAALEAFRRSIEELSREELIRRLIQEHEELSQAQARATENGRVSVAMTREHQRTLKELEETRAEVKKLTDICKKQAEQLETLRKFRFGRHTETSEALLNNSGDENIDPLDEEIEADPVSPPPINFETAARELANKKKKRNKRPKGKREDDISGLEKVDRFNLDVAALDAQYGPDGWELVNWHESTHVVHVKEYLYAEIWHEPVYKDLKTGKLHCGHMPEFLAHGSFVTPSLLVMIYYLKYAMGMPLYRIEKHWATFGLILSRQTMANWAIQFAFLLLFPVYEHLRTLLLAQPYHQSDETTYMVLRDGRKAGSKSYIWVHATSELYDGHKIVLFCFELTRGTDHLREMYSGWDGTDTSDAYCSYLTMEKETDGSFTVSGCLMHSRRRFADAFALKKLENLTEEQIEALPEAQAINLIAAIYQAENELTNLNAQERYSCRQTEVKPKVDSFYSFVESFDVDEPSVSDKMKEAILYARNHKEQLCLFLTDGNVPIDNGYAERCIKSVAQGRKAYLFSSSIDGAIANTILYTLIETARKNNANPYYYLMYLVTQMQLHLNDSDRSFLADLMPWSEKYRQYEAEERRRTPRSMIPESQVRPARHSPNRKPA